MYSKIAHVPLKDAATVILNTPTGKAIKNNNQAVLYEQPSSNLLDIFSEIPATARPKYDISTILEAEAEYKPHHTSPRTYRPLTTKGITISSHSALKPIMYKKLKKNYTAMLKSNSKSMYHATKGNIYVDQNEK